MKEAVAYKVMQAMGDGMICHDDVLHLRALKTRVTNSGKNGGLGLTEQAWQYIPIAVENGRKIVVGYYNKETKDHLGLDKREEFERRRGIETGWTESYRRKMELGDGIALTTESNQIDLIIANLYDSIGSRYSRAIDCVVELAEKGIVAYRPKTEWSAKNERCALINRIKREFKIVKYEHDILFGGELGREIFGALRQEGETVGSKMVVMDNTIYLQGFKKYKGQKKTVKYYSIGARDRLDDVELYKLETTLEKEFFKGEDIAVSDMRTQPKIQAMVKAELEKTLGGVLALLVNKGGIMSALQKELGYSEQDVTLKEITRSMLSSSRTLTERVAMLEHDMAEMRGEYTRDMTELKRRVEALEAKGLHK